MKTGWTSLGSAARCPQGRGGWSRGLISCFLHQSVSPLLSFSLSLSFERSEWRNGIIRWTTTEGRKKRRRGKALPYTYSDCRFKCLLITKLVPQPPRSRSLCIFISTSYGRFQEEERRRTFHIHPGQGCRRPTVSSPPRDSLLLLACIVSQAMHAPQISRQPA